MKFVKCLNKIHTTVPIEGSNEDIMVQNCELKIDPNDENIHLMHYMFIHKMPTVMNGIHTN